MATGAARTRPRRTRVLLTRVVLAAAMILTTEWGGWPAPAVVGAAVAVLAYARAVVRPARESAIAALLGWAAMLVWAGRGGHAATVVGMLGGFVGVRGPTAGGVAALLAVLTLALGAALAWAGAALVEGLLGAVRASTPGRVTLSETSERSPAAQTP